MLDGKDATEDTAAEEDEEEAAPDTGPEGTESIPPDEHDEDDERGLFGRFTRRLRNRELGDDAWKALGTVISTSDRAKSDFVRMMGREVRHYLDGLQLTDDLKDLISNHSLEIHASLHLKPLPESAKEPEPEEEEAEAEE